MAARHGKPKWMLGADDLGRALRHDGPLTVFLGAGASISSGAPQTGEVENLLTEMFQRFDRGELLDQLHLAADADKATALRERFAGLRPYIGYRCLAAIARSRRVLVVNLNWDPLVAAACARLGVPCLTFDLRDEANRPDPSTLEAFKGVIDVHFHGDLLRPRHASADIGWPSSEDFRFLSQIHCGARRLYLGISLDRDHDVVQVGEELDTGEQGWVYAFFRGPASSDTHEIAARVDSLRGKAPIVDQQPDVDFDKFMLLLADALAPAEDRWAALDPHLRLPSLERLVLPRPDILAPIFDNRCAVLLGEAQIGKTTAAHLAGYLHRLWSPISCAVRYVDDPVSASPALGAPEHESPDDMLVLENPFGDSDYVGAPTIVGQLGAWTHASDTPKLLITSGVGSYDAAAVEVTLELPTSDSVPERWYRQDDLLSFASREAPEERHLVDRIEPGWLDTPARIGEAIAGIEVPRSRNAHQRENQAVEERVGLLLRNQGLARLCALIRLQEFGGEPVPLSTLVTVSGGKTPRGSAADLMLHHYEWDTRPRLRLVHRLDREATDIWMSEHRPIVVSMLDQAHCPPSISRGWDAWTLCDDVRHDRWTEVEARSPRVIGEHMGELLSVRPDATVLGLAAGAEFDEWAAHDLAYSLVRLWDELPAPERNRVLEGLLNRTAALGTYGLLEACLYLRGAAPAEVVDAVHNRLWGYLGDADRRFEVALALDGFAWRVPGDVDWVREWVHAALPRDPILRGVLPVIGAYHPGGAGELGLHGILRVAQIQGLSPEMCELTAWLVRWHFLHQSRARAMLARQHWLDKFYLCRSFLPVPGDADSAMLLWLLQVLEDAGQPGWAFFASCFLMGGLEQKIDQDARHQTLQALRLAGTSDVGVLAAAATYLVAANEPFADDIQSYFSEQENFDALLDSLSRGLVVDGFTVLPPRYAFWSPVAETFRWLGIRFPRLGAYQVSNLDSLVLGVRNAASRCVDQGVGTKEAAARVVFLVSLGDLRVLSNAAFDTSENPALDELVANAIRVMEHLDP